MLTSVDPSTSPRDIYINYNILCLDCAREDVIQYPSESPPDSGPGGPAYKAPGETSYNSHLIRQLRPSENLVCDV